MDLRFPPDVEEFRQEVRSFLQNEVPPKYQFESDFDEDEDKWAFAFEFNRKLGKKGWIGVSWPAEAGGMGKPDVYNFVFKEEMDLHEAPLLNGIGWGLAASALLKFAPEDQKRRFLPPIVKQETYWAEGLTEPDAGSDLSSLKTSAVKDGDDWVISGQKTFTTWGHRMDVMYCAARTDPNVPKHKGISIFCLDMKAPGVTLRPLFNMAGGRQNHTFLDSVRVPRDMIIGEVNQGWYYIMNSFYGVGGPPGTKLRRTLGHLIHYCTETTRNGKPLSKDPLVRARLGELAVGVETLKMIGYDSLWRHEHKQGPQLGGSLSTVYYKEFYPYFAQVAMEVLGPLALIQGDSKWAPLAGDIEHLYRKSYGNHAGGTSQVKRMVMATKGLGLPR